jgi:hypothetical protein
MNPPYPQDSRQRFEWYWQESSDMAHALVGGSKDAHVLFLEDDVMPSLQWFERVLETIRAVKVWDALLLYTPDTSHVPNGARSEFTSCSQALLFHSSIASTLSQYLQTHIGSKPPDLLLADVMKSMDVRIVNPPVFQHNKALQSTRSEKASLTPHTSSTFAP